MDIELNYQYFQDREPSGMHSMAYRARDGLERVHRARTALKDYKSGNENKAWLKDVDRLYADLDEVLPILEVFFTIDQIEEFIHRDMKINPILEQSIPELKIGNRIFNINPRERTFDLANSLHTDEDLKQNDIRKMKDSFWIATAYRSNLVDCFLRAFEAIGHMLVWIYTGLRLNKDASFKDTNRAIRHIANYHLKPSTRDVSGPNPG